MENNAAAIRSKGFEFTKGKQFIYAFADFGYNFVWTLVSSFLLYFWTDSIGFSAGFAGTAMLVSRIWDACTCPVIGRLADNTKSKHGKYRPWILYAAVPLCIINVLCFTTMPIQNPVMQKAWYVGIFFVAIIISSMFYLPYTAMISSLTVDSETRTRCSSLRLGCAYAAAIIITRYTTKLVGFFGQGDNAKGYVITAVVYSILGIFCWLLLFFNSKEIIEVKSDKFSIKESIGLLARNKYIWILGFAFIFYGLFNYGRNATAIYYFTYVAGNASMYGNYGLVHYGMSLVGALVMPRFAAKSKNKGSVSRYSYLVCGCLLICQFFVDPTTTSGMAFLLVAQAVASMCAGMAASMLYGLIPDVVDYTQYIHGSRAAGFVTAFVNFLLKIGMAFGVALVGWLLSATGYVANMVQSASTILGLKTLFAILPGAFAIIAFVFMCFYGLDKKTHQNILVKMKLVKEA